MLDVYILYKKITWIYIILIVKLIVFLLLCNIISKDITIFYIEKIKFITFLKDVKKMEDGPQNINCDTTKTKYVQKENLLSII